MKVQNFYKSQCSRLVVVGNLFWRSQGRW